MFPITDYAIFQRRQAELLKQADMERLIHQAESDRPGTLRLRHVFASWLGLHLIKWGQKLKQVSASHNRQHTTSISTRSSSL